MRRRITIVCTLVMALLLIAFSVQAATTVNSYDWMTGLNLSTYSSNFTYPQAGNANIQFYCSYSGYGSSATARLMKVVSLAPDTTVASCSGMTAGSLILRQNMYITKIVAVLDNHTIGQ